MYPIFFIPNDIFAKPMFLTYLIETSFYLENIDNTGLSVTILHDRTMHFSLKYDVILKHQYEYVYTIWQYGLWSFQTWGTKLERFLPKNQHTQRKLLNFENWVNGEASKSAKI